MLLTYQVGAAEWVACAMPTVWLEDLLGMEDGFPDDPRMCPHCEVIDWDAVQAIGN